MYKLCCMNIRFMCKVVFLAHGEPLQMPVIQNSGRLSPSSGCLCLSFAPLVTCSRLSPILTVFILSTHISYFFTCNLKYCYGVSHPFTQMLGLLSHFLNNAAKERITVAYKLQNGLDKAGNKFPSVHTLNVRLVECVCVCTCLFWITQETLQPLTIMANVFTAH